MSFSSFPFLTTFLPLCFHLLYLSFSFSFLLFPFFLFHLFFSSLYIFDCLQLHVRQLFFPVSHDTHTCILTFTFQISRTIDACTEVVHHVESVVKIFTGFMVSTLKLSCRLDKQYSSNTAEKSVEQKMLLIACQSQSRRSLGFCVCIVR